MALTINSWSFDQAVYTSGQTITLTVNYTPDTTGGTVDTAADITVTVTDASNTATQASTTDPNTAFPQFTVQSGSPETAEPTTVTVTDDRSTPGAWTLVSNTLTTAAPFTGVAVLTSVA
jgi:hypothetical protein